MRAGVMPSILSTHMSPKQPAQKPEV